MAQTPFFAGKDVKMRLWSNNSEVVLNAKSWSAKLVAEKVADGVNGEDRDRLQRIPKYWEFTVEGFQRDVKAFNAFLADIGNDDAEVAPFVNRIGIQVKMLDGTKGAFIAKEVTIDDPEINMGGRTDRVMLRAGFRARYFNATQSV